MCQANCSATTRTTVLARSDGNASTLALQTGIEKNASSTTSATSTPPSIQLDHPPRSP